MDVRGPKYYGQTKIIRNSEKHGMMIVNSIIGAKSAL